MGEIMNTAADTSNNDVKRRLEEVNKKLEAIKSLEEERLELQSQMRKVAKNEMIDLARNYGFEVTSIVFSDDEPPIEAAISDDKKERQARRPSEYLFINPNEPDKKAWPGRGAKPKWYIDAINRGIPVEDIAHPNSEYDDYLTTSGMEPRPDLDYLKAAKEKYNSDKAKATSNTN